MFWFELCYDSISLVLRCFWIVKIRHCILKITHFDWATLGGGMLVGVLAWVKVSGGELVTGGRFQLELLSIRSGQVVGLRVEVEGPGKGQSSDNLRLIT